MISRTTTWQAVQPCSGRSCGYAAIGLSPPRTSFLHPRRFRLPDLEQYPAFRTAADRIGNAINGGEVIGVWGDFDTDGLAGTAILVGVLQRLGARVVLLHARPRVGWARSQRRRAGLGRGTGQHLAHHL